VGVSKQLMLAPPPAFGPHICPLQERLALNEGSLKQHMQHGLLSHRDIGVNWIRWLISDAVARYSIRALQ
jgi:hypothetical protein